MFFKEIFILKPKLHLFFTGNLSLIMVILITVDIKISELCLFQ